MTFTQFIAALSSETGLDIEDVGGAAAVEIDGVTIRLHDADGDLLLLLADLGGSRSRATENATAALEANYLYSGTGGCTLAVNPSDGHLTLQKYTWLDRLSPDATSASLPSAAVELLTRFAETALRWQPKPTE